MPVLLQVADAEEETDAATAEVSAAEVTVADMEGAMCPPFIRMYPKKHFLRTRSGF